jgi:hypothetical protein
MTLLIQRVTVCLITLVWCWSKSYQSNDPSIWLFGVLAGLIDWLAYESGKQMGVFMVVTLPSQARERIIAEYNASQHHQQQNNNNGDNDDNEIH